MAAPGSAKTRDANASQSTEHNGLTAERRGTEQGNSWHVWKQVIIAELLNLFDGGRGGGNNPR